MFGPQPLEEDQRRPQHLLRSRAQPTKLRQLLGIESLSGSSRDFATLRYPHHIIFPETSRKRLEAETIRYFMPILRNIQVQASKTLNAASPLHEPRHNKVAAFLSGIGHSSEFLPDRLEACKGPRTLKLEKLSILDQLWMEAKWVLHTPKRKPRQPRFLQVQRPGLCLKHAEALLSEGLCGTLVRRLVALLQSLSGEEVPKML